jgi:hypothetical protein
MGRNGNAANRARSAIGQPKVGLRGLDPRIHALVSGAFEGVDARPRRNRKSNGWLFLLF